MTQNKTFLKKDILTAAFAVAMCAAAGLLMSMPQWIFFCLTAALMAYISYTDIHFRKIRTKSMYILLALDIVSLWVFPVPVSERLLSGVLVAASLTAAIVFTGILLKTKKPVGGGDVRLLLCTALLFGYDELYVIIIASAAALIYVSAAAFLTGKSLKELPKGRICLGPFMALATDLMLLKVLSGM